ncbi:MAG: hypothetical protein AVDCRST_MAG56-2497 [uncultured Cytophagales bacterium]|uniref:Uncharacterized protein n=1 Tax=uncultured Cytophagales bacterium TaxID=158755 RepID=A0A6J4IV67_9SPHI|nr:MAG: hypothetical protein AVDCRST_MAG56-2497 [uncultured Cytophagales bacterium]
MEENPYGAEKLWKGRGRRGRPRKKSVPGKNGRAAGTGRTTHIIANDAVEDLCEATR